MYFRQNAHAQRFGGMAQGQHLVWFQNGGDEQNEVGALLARQIDLDGIKDKIFLQQKRAIGTLSIQCFGGKRQIGIGAAKPRFVAEHGNGPHPCVRVGAELLW